MAKNPKEVDRAQLDAALQALKALKSMSVDCKKARKDVGQSTVLGKISNCISHCIAQIDKYFADRNCKGAKRRLEKSGLRFEGDGLDNCKLLRDGAALETDTLLRSLFEAEEVAGKSAEEVRSMASALAKEEIGLEDPSPELIVGAALFAATEGKSLSLTADKCNALGKYLAAKNRAELADQKVKGLEPTGMLKSIMETSRQGHEAASAMLEGVNAEIASKAQGGAKDLPPR